MHRRLCVCTMTVGDLVPDFYPTPLVVAKWDALQKRLCGRTCSGLLHRRRHRRSREDRPEEAARAFRLRSSTPVPVRPDKWAARAAGPGPGLWPAADAYRSATAVRRFQPAGRRET